MRLDSPAWLRALPRDVPVDPDAEEARRLVLEELSKPPYEAAQPTWFDRLSTAFWEWLTSLEVEGGTGPPGLLLAVIVVIVVAALVVAFLVFGVPALNRRSAVGGALFGDEDERTAAVIRRAAEDAARRGQWTIAIEERFRALARGLAERTIITTNPGTTAHGFAVRAGAAFPDRAAALATAADTFDRVRYLGRDGTEDAYRQVTGLDEDLRTAAASAGVPTGAGS